MGQADIGVETGDACGVHDALTLIEVVLATSTTRCHIVRHRRGEPRMSDRTTVNHLLAASRSRIDRFEPRAAQAAFAAGALAIDTRCAEQRHETGVIPGSIHVPLSVLYWRLDPNSGSKDPALADPERRVILICAHGYSSSIAAATLRDLGFSLASDIDGGFEAWQMAGLPIEAEQD